MRKDTAQLVYLETGMLLTRKEYRDWRELQTEYWEVYTASLEPMTAGELMEYFQWDLGEEKNWPFSRREIEGFFAGNEETLFLEAKE